MPSRLSLVGLIVDTPAVYPKQRLHWATKQRRTTPACAAHNRSRGVLRVSLTLSTGLAPLPPVGPSGRASLITASAIVPWSCLMSSYYCYPRLGIIPNPAERLDKVILMPEAKDLSSTEITGTSSGA